MVEEPSNSWFHSKYYFDQISSILESGNADLAGDLADLLSKTRPTLCSLLKNQPRNSADRLKVQEAARSGDNLQLRPGRNVKISQTIADESLILSDLFELDELNAVELVLAGEQEQPNLAGLARGLCAVLCYFHKQCFDAQLLRFLIQSTGGRMWPAATHKNIVAVVSNTVDSLWKDNLLNRILELLSNYDLSKELDKLQQPNVKGLGGPKHRKLVSDLISGCYEALADCVLYYSAQNSLNRAEFTSLLTFIRNSDLSYGFRNVEASLVMAVLYAFDTSLLEAVDTEQDLEMLPFVEESYLQSFHSQMCDFSWKSQPLGAFVKFAWAISLRTIAQHHLTQQVMVEFAEDEEELLERALDDRPLGWIKKTLFELPDFGTNELWARRMHSIVTQFIISFPIKIKELTARADEQLRIAMDAMHRGEHIPTINLHLEQFLLMMADLYGAEKGRYQLCEDFWCSPELMADNDSYMQMRFSQRQLNLYKFVRSAGDQSSAVMVVAYLKMLKGICQTPCSAQQTFALLANNGAHDSHLSCMSWNHFFSALRNYHQTFKADLNLTGAHHRIPQTVEISPDEQEGLIAWLNLAAQVANMDSSNVVTFCDHPNWSALSSVCGLVSCPIALDLKGALFNFMAQLTKSQAMVQKVWEGLMGGNGPAVKIAGIQRELNEVECRNEEYASSVGFLRVIDALCEHSADLLPNTETMKPVLEFVIDSIVNKFLNRSYKQSRQMWETGKLGVDVLYKLTRHFNPTLHGVRKETPGFVIMTRLMVEGPLFRNLTWILNEGIKLLEQYTDFPGKSEFESLSLCVLRLFDEVLSKQNLLLDAIRESGISTLTSTLDLLLQTLNPRTMAADHVTTIASYLQFSKLCSHALAASRVLRSLANTCPSIQPKLVQYCSRTDAAKQLILAGFVDCLTLEDLAAPVQIDTSDNAPESHVRGLTAICIIEMMCESLKICPAEPNLAFLLLGFDPKRPENTHIENPGINGFPRTCLHSLVHILKSCIDRPWNDIQFLSLIEPTARLVLALASNGGTAEPTLRYLRTAHDLIYEMVPQIICEPAEAMGSESSQIRTQLCGLLLKLCATELRQLSLYGQNSQCSRLATILLEQDQIPAAVGDTTLGMTQSSNRTQLNATATVLGITSKQQHRPESRLMTVLRLLDFSVPEQPNPELHFFDARRLSEVIGACTAQSTSGCLQCDVSQLHGILSREVAALQGSSFANQQTIVYKEVELVLESVVEYNQSQRWAAANIFCFEGWRLSVEILFSVVLFDLGWPVETLIEMVAQLMSDLLQKASEATLVTDLATGVASACLELSGSLRAIFSNDIKAGRDELSKTAESGGKSFLSNQYVSILDRTHGDKGFELENWKHIAALLPAFRLLIEFLLKPGNRSPSSRLLCYGAFLNIVLLNTKPKDSEWANLDGLSVRERMGDDQWNVLRRYGPELVQLMAKDATEGADVCKTLALCCLSAVLQQDALRDASLVELIVKAGYVRHLVESLNKDDDPKMSHLMKTTVTSLRPLYVFETKLALFMRVAMSDIGMEALCHNKLLSCMQSWLVWQEVPDKLFVTSQALAQEEPQVHLSVRYLNALQSSLKLCLAMSATARGSQPDVRLEVAAFVRLHGALLSQLLRLKPESGTAASRVLELAAKLVAQCYGFEDELGGDSKKGKTEDRLIEQLKLEARKLLRRTGVDSSVTKSPTMNTSFFRQLKSF